MSRLAARTTRTRYPDWPRSLGSIGRSTATSSKATEPYATTATHPTKITPAALLATALASRYGKRLLIENQAAGTMYRLLFLDGQLLDTVRRLAARVVGDGRSSIRELAVGAEELEALLD